MSYIIKNIEKDYWLNIDRVINNATCEVTTIVEPVYNYNVATKFNSPEECAEIMAEIKKEGNYDIPAYATENVEELIEAEKQAKKQKQEKFQKVAQGKLDSVVEKLKKAGCSDEEIQSVLNQGIYISNEELKEE